MVSAELSGGNFWQEAETGAIVPGLNHLAHRATDDPKKPTLKDLKTPPD